MPKVVQKLLLSQKNLKKYNDQGGALQKKLLFKNFLRKHQCWSLLLIKIQAYRPANLLKRDSNTGVFLTVIAKFLRAAILKSICERLLLRVFPCMLV